jgi:hypothetical protein
VGSFHICPYVDCNDNKTFDFMAKDGTRIDREPFIMMNLVLVRVRLHQDNSVARSGNMRAQLPGGDIKVKTGKFKIDAPTEAAIHMSVLADLVGGGNVGRRGLIRVFAGWCNNETANEDVVATYTTLAPPPPTHRVSAVFASNVAALPRTQYKRFLPSGPAPVLVAPTLLDTGRGSPGTGGRKATLSRSRVRTRTNLVAGQRWLVECVDSPSEYAVATHPGFPGTALVRFRFHLDFRVFLCFWTNASSSDRATGDPCDRLYSILREFAWKMRAEWTLAGGVLAAVTPATVTISGKKTHKPIARAADAGIETRAPSTLDMIGYDARV